MCMGVEEFIGFWNWATLKGMGAGMEQGERVCYVAVCAS